MSLRSTSYICQRLTNAVKYILRYHYDTQIINYLDDLTGCEKAYVAVNAFDNLSQVLEQCGLDKAPEKTVSLSSAIIFLFFGGGGCMIPLNERYQ